jgi:hypothetical protein
MLIGGDAGAFDDDSAAKEPPSSDTPSNAAIAPLPNRRAAAEAPSVSAVSPASAADTARGREERGSVAALLERPASNRSTPTASAVVALVVLVVLVVLVGASDASAGRGAFTGVRETIGTKDS